MLTGRVKIRGQNRGSYPLMLAMGVPPPPSLLGILACHSCELCRSYDITLMGPDNRLMKLTVKTLCK